MSSVKLKAIRLRMVTPDVPRSVAYYGGVALAVAVGVLEPPLGLLIAAMPLLKRTTHRALPVVIRFAGKALEGTSTALSQLDELSRLEDQAHEILSKAHHGNRSAGRAQAPQTAARSLGDNRKPSPR
jgi:hypothetical protein